MSVFDIHDYDLPDEIDATKSCITDLWTQFKATDDRDNILDRITENEAYLKELQYEQQRREAWGFIKK